MYWLLVCTLCSNHSIAQNTAAIPPNDYNIMVFYELGMHCTGFDLSYCCVLPPYNSVLAQIVKPPDSREKNRKS